ncbi:MAG TPA: hypothetical protein PKM21_16020 [Anaerolineales bacterium]|nr:hypothetical protein [Anaerolineales bacterium]
MLNNVIVWAFTPFIVTMFHLGHITTIPFMVVVVLLVLAVWLGMKRHEPQLLAEYEQMKTEEAK